MPARTRRRLGFLVVVVVLVIGLCSASAIAHPGHDGHEGSGLSIWPFLLVFGTVTAGGSLFAAHRFDVRSEHALGLAAGGAVMASVAAVVWFV